MTQPTGRERKKYMGRFVCVKCKNYGLRVAQGPVVSRMTALIFLVSLHGRLLLKAIIDANTSTGTYVFFLILVYVANSR